MSSILSEFGGYPHAFLVTKSDSVDLPFRADALLLCGIAATTATIQITTSGGETLTIPFSVTALPASGMLLLPVQVKRVWNTSTTGIAAIVGLYH